MKRSLSLDAIKKRALNAVHTIARYRTFIFFLAASMLYTFIIWRINVLAVSTPTEAEVQTATEQQSVPTIKPSVVQKINSLKDNSVNVQTLFEQSRNNPFSD